jgi:hypothetical protein
MKGVLSSLLCAFTPFHPPALRRRLPAVKSNLLPREI